MSRCFSCFKECNVILYALCGCKFAKKVWKVIGFWNLISDNKNTEFVNFFQTVISSCQQIEVEVITRIMWSIWHTRNKAYFEKTKEIPLWTMTKTEVMLESYRLVHLNNVEIDLSAEEEVKDSWTKPPIGWFKLNTDASIYI